MKKHGDALAVGEQVKAHRLSLSHMRRRLRCVAVLTKVKRHDAADNKYISDVPALGNMEGVCDYQRTWKLPPPACTLRL